MHQAVVIRGQKRLTRYLRVLDVAGQSHQEVENPDNFLASCTGTKYHATIREQKAAFTIRLRISWRTFCGRRMTKPKRTRTGKIRCCERYAGGRGLHWHKGDANTILVAALNMNNIAHHHAYRLERLSTPCGSYYVVRSILKDLLTHTLSTGRGVPPSVGEGGSRPLWSKLLALKKVKKNKKIKTMPWTLVSLYLVV